MDSAVEKALTKVATTEAGSLSDIEASIAAAQAGDRDAARQILSGGPMTNALLNHLREQMGKRASALGIGVADRLATANVVEPTRLLTKSYEARPAQQQKKEMTMRKMIYLVGAVAIAVVAAGYVWSPSTQIPSPQRVMATEVASMISPTEIMTNSNRPLPVEQWDAF
jgi:hypothetical protein